MPQTKKLWKDEELTAGMSVRQACWVLNVPRNILGDRVSGQVTNGCRSGPKQRLSPDDEKALV